MALILNEFYFEFLRMAKMLDECGIADMKGDYLGNMELCDDCYLLAWEGISNVFARYENYYRQETEIETMVFFDPVITEFYSLCERYETAKGIPKADNPFRKDGENRVYEQFSTDAYDYGVHLYDGSHGKCRLVILTGEEFCGTYELPEVLLNVKYAFMFCNEKLKRVAAAEESALAVASGEIQEKEAA